MRKRIVVIASVSVVGVLSAFLYAQQSSVAPATARLANQPGYSMPPAQGYGPATYFPGPGMPLVTIPYGQSPHGQSPRQQLTKEESERRDAFRTAIEELRNAKDDDAKVEARTKVNELINEQLDHDFKQREKQLADIEQRAKQLREQLEQRRTAKPEMAKMLMLLVENPQAGLGLPPEWMQVMTQGGPGMGYGTAGGPAYAVPGNFQNPELSGPPRSTTAASGVTSTFLNEPGPLTLPPSELDEEPKVASPKRK